MGMYYPDEDNVEATPPWEITLNDPDRFPGQDATEEIAAGWLTPFYEGWTREVVYRRARPNICEIYYWSPDRVKLRSRGTAEDYFTANPPNNPHLSPMQLCWTRKPLGLNNLCYEMVRRAKTQGTHLPPPQPLNVFHEHPGDISAESWGFLKPMEPEGDLNANTKDLACVITLN